MTPVHLTRIIPEENQRRYYHMHIERGLFGDWGLVREWGRIGRSGQSRTDWFDSEAEAVHTQCALETTKMRRGYLSADQISPVNAACSSAVNKEHNILWPDSVDSARILEGED